VINTKNYPIFLVRTTKPRIAVIVKLLTPGPFQKVYSLEVNFNSKYLDV